MKTLKHKRNPQLHAPKKLPPLKRSALFMAIYVAMRFPQLILKREKINVSPSPGDGPTP